MTTIEKVKQLSDNEVLSHYQGFSMHLMNQIQVDSMDVIKNLPENLIDDPSIQLIRQFDEDQFDSEILPGEVIGVVRTQMEQWAQDTDLSPLLDEFMSSNKIHSMAAGMVLAVGAVLVMTIVSGSLKIKYKDGKLAIDYSSKNIDNNVVKLVNSIIPKMPDSIKNLLPIK